MRHGATMGGFVPLARRIRWITAWIIIAPCLSVSVFGTIEFLRLFLQALNKAPEAFIPLAVIMSAIGALWSIRVIVGRGEQ